MSELAAESTQLDKPRRADARRNHERLLAAARAALAEQGADANMEDVAHQAGVGIGTLYRHFPTRQALCEAVYLDQVNELQRLAERLLDDPVPVHALVTWLRTQLVLGANGKSLGASVMSAKHQEGSEINCASVEMRAAGDQLLARAKLAGEVSQDVELGDLLRLIHGILLVNENSQVDPERTERMFSLVLAGLRP
ncbi:MAG: TetR/AcrR family transcriptional regulator [Acidimicrobiales bacterium]